MDPLYANLDKRNNSADQPQTPPAPQPTAYSMPNFGQTSMNNASTTPVRPIISSSESTTPQPIISAPLPQPVTLKSAASSSGDIILEPEIKKSRKILVTMIILSLVIIGGGIAWFFLNNTTPISSSYSLEDFNALYNEKIGNNMSILLRANASSDPTIYIIDGQDIADLKTMYEKISQKEQKQLATLGSNIDFLNSINEIASSIEESVSSGGLQCGDEEKISNLIDGYPSSQNNIYSYRNASCSFLYKNSPQTSFALRVAKANLIRELINNEER